MGFENRKSVRVKLDAQVYFWLGDTEAGPGLWGHTKNLSATGLAFNCGQAGVVGQAVLLELSLPGQQAAVRLLGHIVHCGREASASGQFEWRVNFEKLEGDERQQVRQYVLEVAEPGTGWGRAYFEGVAATDVKFKEMAVADREQWLLKRQYLSFKELGYLKQYQNLIEHVLGSRNPERLKILGSRPLKEGSDVWIELDLPMGHLHFLAKTLWCRHEPGEKVESGLQLIAFHKDEAMKLDKEF